MPEGVTDRSAEIWEPLLAIADTAGGHWPDTNADKLEARRPDLGTLFDDAINPVCRRSKTAGKCTAS
jgi:hypothetical protein